MKFELAAIYSFMKNNKEEITVELEEQDIGTLGKLCSERKACSQK